MNQIESRKSDRRSLLVGRRIDNASAFAYEGKERRIAKYGSRRCKTRRRS